MKCVWISGWGERADIFSQAISQSGLTECSVCFEGMQFFSARDRVSPSGVSSAAERLVTTLKRMDSSILLVGWSLGGMLAIEAAAELEGRVRSLLIVSTAARFVDPDYSRRDLGVEGLRQFRDTFERSPQQALQSFYRRSSAHSRSPSEGVAEMAEAQRGVLSVGLDYLAEMDTSERLRQLEVPFVALHGKEDRITPCPPMDTLFERSAIFKFDRCGHRLPLERPRELGIMVRMQFDSLC